jgi:MFS transporter, SHS family, lactate transporter
VARWCRVGDGKLAGMLAWHHERPPAGSWGIGFLLSSAAYGLLYDSIGWRGLLWLGILPALAVLYVRRFVKEPEVWVANRDKQREQNKQFHAPLLDIFRRGVAGNTITACLWMASS